MPSIACSAAAASAVTGAAVDSPACYQSDLSQAEPNLSSYIHSERHSCARKSLYSHLQFLFSLRDTVVPAFN